MVNELCCSAEGKTVLRLYRSSSHAACTETHCLQKPTNCSRAVFKDEQQLDNHYLIRILYVHCAYYTVVL